MSAEAPVTEKPGNYWWGVLIAFAVDLMLPALAGLLTNLLLLAFTSFHFETLSFMVRPLSGLVFASLMGIGITQWLWLTPLAYRFRKHGYPSLAKGIITGGWMVLLINAGCWGLVGFNLRHGF